MYLIEAVTFRGLSAFSQVHPSETEGADLIFLTTSTRTCSYNTAQRPEIALRRADAIPYSVPTFLTTLLILSILYITNRVLFSYCDAKIYSLLQLLPVSPMS